MASGACLQQTIGPIRIHPPPSISWKAPPMPNIGQEPLTRLQHLSRYGYYVEHGLFTPDHLARIREATARLMRDAKPESDTPSQTYYPNIIEFDDAFAQILDNPTFLKVCIYIDELPIDGGPTGVVPESHFDIYKGEEFYPHKIDFLPRPGSMLAFAASTMHRAGLHALGRPPRPAMFFVFIPWWIKQATYYTGNRNQRLIESASPMRRQLLGVEMRPGINMDLYTQG